MKEEYILATPDGPMLHPRHQNRFFEELHASLERDMLDGNQFLHQEVDGSLIEIRLPPVEELLRNIQVVIRDRCFVICVNFPAQVIGEGKKITFQQEFQFDPPPLVSN